ncbi:MAG TPA: toll/interleukin-1 receptor domain-containing protein [Rhodanobacteraceae bacterium]|nr:toll/interleukin-1 receptor domain-containing protein [Rhodanobacteraceae bacterium]
MSASSVSRFTYRAFLSYSHHDRAWADWLHKALETYRVPARLVGAQTLRGTIPRRLNPIFRDREELASATDLGAEINEALRQSENLVVICSPAAAASRWVNEEVLAYKRMGRGGRIFCLIVAGEPGASDLPGREAEECFCPALRFVLATDGRLSSEPTEPIAADARRGKDGRAHAKLKLIAGMLGVGLDTLMQREAHRRRRRMLVVTAASLLGMAIATGFAITAYVARNEARQRQAQTEDTLNFMLGDLHEKLEATGRLDLMSAVTDRAMALFAASKPGSLTDVELTQESQALVQIGQIRLQEARYGPAMDAFRRAEQRSAELAARHPDDGRFLYDRAQAESWIGSVYWQQRRLTDAGKWFTRYRDSTLALLKIDPENKDWQLESTYGEHNLAVLALDRGELDAAQHGFRAELATQQRLALEQRDNTELAANMANTVSWLGTVAERKGDLSGALHLFTTQAEQLGALRAKHPEDVRWLIAWSAAKQHQTEALQLVGQVGQAKASIDAVVAALEALVEKDPANRDWQAELAASLVRRAYVDAAAKDASAADAASSRAVGILETNAREADAHVDKSVTSWLSRAWRLRAVLALQRGHAKAASDAAGQSLEEATRGAATDAVDDEALADRADALLTVGAVERARSPDVTPPTWKQAYALLATRAPGSHYWRLLDPWVRVCRLTGDDAGARIALDRLNLIGYVPLQPWPETGGDPSTATEGTQHVE